MDDITVTLSTTEARRILDLLEHRMFAIAREPGVRSGLREGLRKEHNDIAGIIRKFGFNAEHIPARGEE